MRRLQALALWCAASITMIGASALVAVNAEAATTYVAVGSVYIRKGPSTSYAKLGVLSKGKSITGSGKKSGGWTQVTYKNTTAYIYGSYLKVRSTTSATSTATSAPTSSSQSSASPVTTTAAASSTPTVTSASTQPSTTATQASKMKMVTRIALTLRTKASATSSAAGSVVAGTTVTTTGQHSGSYSQITRSGSSYWVLTGYLNPANSSVDPLPVASARVYTQVTSTAVSTSPGGTATDTLTKGTVLQVTGKKSGKYSQVIYDGDGDHWTDTAKLASTKPGAAASSSSTSISDLGTSSLNKLQTNAKVAVLAVRELWPSPKIKTIHGWRSSSAYSSDHPNGRATDIMIPSYKSSTGKALGTEIANYFIANAKKYEVTYIIWRQRSYTITRGKWVSMSDRGGDTANHYDHVHVSFQKQ